MNITETVKSFLEKYELENKRLSVGFSGGYDSLCLLDIIKKLGYSPIALHLNHNWRGDESQRDEDFCKEFCKKNGIEFYTEKLSADVPHTETAAREARYEFFEKCAEKFHLKVVLTAHNLDDTVETVLYRIIKGTGVTGLKGISEKRDIFYRPLLDVPRSAIEEYCRQNNLNGVNDSSNSDTKYKRNFIRHKLLPQINEINQNYAQAIKNLSYSADETAALADEYMVKIIEETGNSTEKFVKLSTAAQNYLIYDFFICNNLDYDRKKITSVVDFINTNSSSKSGKKASVTNNLWIFANREKFEFINSSTNSNSEIQINNEGSYKFDDCIFCLEKIDDNPETFPSDREFTAYIEADNINFTLRHRKDGDIIFPLGAKGSQKLKKYLNEKKIPNHEKDNIVLLCKKNEVLWAAGLGISEKIKVVNKATHVIKLFKKEG